MLKGSLFVSVDSSKIVNLTQYHADYFIDNSGSTAGSILNYEQQSVLNICNFLKPNKIIAWNSFASAITSVESMRSTGGTNPTCFVPFVERSNCMVVYTDGQIGLEDMQRFKTAMENKTDNVPVVIVFAVSSLTQTIGVMERTVNMSIPETFLSLSNDVIILITAKGEHKTLMAKGSFAQFPTLGLTNELSLTELPDFQFSWLKDIQVVGGLPAHVIKLKGMEQFIDLNVLYTLEDVSEEVLEGLCDRTILPKLNASALHALLNRIQRKLAENPELDRIRDELWQMSSSPQAGSAEHQQLIRRYHEVRSAKKFEGGRQKAALVNKLLEMISEYQRNSTSIVYGSNRAMRSTAFDNALLAQLDGCLQVECPILLSTGDACILIKEPSSSSYIEEYTSDLAMEAPFEFGTWLTPLITPGLFSIEIAEVMNTNPYTREKVIGFLPISFNPAVIMRHMSKLFGGNKELWHFVRGYIAMISQAVRDYPWFHGHQELIIPSLKLLMENYHADAELRSGNEKIPLLYALKNTLENYSTLLRDRTYDDVIAIMNISKLLYPDFLFHEERIMGMITVVKEFSQLLVIHKTVGSDMIAHVMEVDDYGHYVTYVPGVKGLIAQILWYDIHGVYKLLKLQLAVDKALGDRRYGAALRAAIMGQSWDESILECKTPEPTGSHFPENLETAHLTWTAEGYPELSCVFCNQCFASSQEKFVHLKEAYGDHFYNGLNACKHAVFELGPHASEKEIFQLAKKKLFKHYTDKRKALHTKRCKQRLLYFIRKFVAGAHSV